ncbi:hypothetical protein M0805_004358 [Coniferiporia weirii]|nr:hypothetical protein M0805_004358 [Coniferiporia weirii]
MDVDQPDNLQHTSTGEHHVNAQAGPSSLPDVPAVFLPPPGPSRRKPLFDSTQDLITRFKLLPSYDKYVRPHAYPVGSGAHYSNQTPASTGVLTPGPHHSAPTPGAVDKGKGRETSAITPHTPGAPTPTGADGGDGDDGDEEGGKGDKKQKNSYRHLIKGIPGKHSTKKDDYLQNIMLVPPKQKISIHKLDPRTQREAFSVSLEGLKGWNINTLVAESAQAREDRKKRKELKKLAKAQAQAAQAGVPFPVPPVTTSSSAAPTPATVATPGFRLPQTPASMGVGTPRPQGPGPGPPTHTGVKTAARPGTPAQAQGTGPPRSSTPVPRPGSRGKKRELEEDSTNGPGAMPNGSGFVIGAGQMGLKRAPPGSGSVKSGVPRPLKRPRTDATPHPMGLTVVPHQQPTPQGV